ncbi:SUMF1/EgtB/PvdO family nonheme iron enzyme [bacterium]|nr:SUMF1/EgtB/PvdO family nonheme iron enzyme [bacterium]
MRYRSHFFAAVCLVPVVCFCLNTDYAFGAMEREPGFSYPVITVPYKPVPFKPKQYIVYRTIGPVVIDGALDETSWENAPWTDRFGHIFMEGYRKPFLATRAKMLWDDTNLYAAVELEEPNLLGHMFEKDTEMYLDNDIEMFIDVDGDSQDYIELEFNCLGTLWDMLLPKEYNRGGIPLSHPKIDQSPPWDLEGMRIAVRVDGTLNYPFDTDKNWVIEISIPWKSLQKTSRTGEKLDRGGSSFRLNFSRVEHPWPRDVWPITDWENRGGPGFDWTWSQNLVYNMHSGESWGRVILSERTVLQAPDVNLEHAFPFVEPPESRAVRRAGGMVKIKGGTYTIGPDSSDPVASPAGTVTVKDFYIDRCEVTVGEFAAFLNASGGAEWYVEDMANPDFCGIVKTTDGKYAVVPGRDMYPVTLVKQGAARAYAAWAGKRLPTEFEWEIAARGSEGRLYPWGNEPPDDSRANFDYRVGYTTPVGSYEKGKTPLGVYDMAGNVWEFVDGTWSEYAWDKKPETPRTSGNLMRGGSWVTPAVNLRSTYRDGQKGEFTPMAGFRCAKDAE